MLILPWVPLVWLPQVSVSAPSASVAPSVLLKGAPPSTPPGPHRHRGSHHQTWRRHRPRHTCGSNGWFLAVFLRWVTQSTKITKVVHWKIYCNMGKHSSWWCSVCIYNWLQLKVPILLLGAHYISSKLSYIIICIIHQSSNAWKLHLVFIHVHSKLHISARMAPIIVLLACISSLSRLLPVFFKLICCSSSHNHKIKKTWCNLCNVATLPDWHSGIVWTKSPAVWLGFTSKKNPTISFLRSQQSSGFIIRCWWNQPHLNPYR